MGMRVLLVCVYNLGGALRLRSGEDIWLSIGSHSVGGRT